MNANEALLTIAVVAVLTFITRFLPFALFARHSKPPPVLKSLGKLLPTAVIAVLVVYCLKSIDFSQTSTFVPEIISVPAVVGLHIWKRNNLLSIGAGTALYMVLTQVVFS